MSGNASATANNIATHETLFRLGILSDLFTATMAIVLTLALYPLFKGVDEGLAYSRWLVDNSFLTSNYGRLARDPDRT